MYRQCREKQCILQKALVFLTLMLFKAKQKIKNKNWLYGFQWQFSNLSLLVFSGSVCLKLLVSSKCRKRWICLFLDPSSSPAIDKLECLWNKRKGTAVKIKRRFRLGKLGRIFGVIAGKKTQNYKYGLRASFPQDMFLIVCNIYFLQVLMFWFFCLGMQHLWWDDNLFVFVDLSLTEP